MHLVKLWHSNLFHNLGLFSTSKRVGLNPLWISQVVQSLVAWNYHLLSFDLIADLSSLRTLHTKAQQIGISHLCKFVEFFSKLVRDFQHLARFRYCKICVAMLCKFYFILKASCNTKSFQKNCFQVHNNQAKFWGNFFCCDFFVLFQITLLFVVFLVKDVQEKLGFIAWQIGRI